MNLAASQDAVAYQPNRVAALLEGAADGDNAALQRLAAEIPECKELIKQVYGDMSARIEESLIRAHAGQDLLETEALKGAVAELRTRLADANACPLEWLLIDRIACNWLHTNLCDLRLAEFQGELSQRARLQKQQSVAEQRLYRACRSLAQVRKITGKRKKNGGQTSTEPR